jgi:hypothetical protein
MITADAIFGRPLVCRPSTPSTLPLLTTVIETLPTIDDDRIAALVEQLALAIVEIDEVQRGTRELLSEALVLLHARHTENAQLRQRGADLLEVSRPLPARLSSALSPSWL